MKLSAGWVVGAGCAVSVGLVAAAILAPHVTAFQAGGTSTRAARAPGVPDYITGVVQSVSIEVNPDDNTKRTYTLHVNGQSIDLQNVREVQ